MSRAAQGQALTPPSRQEQHTGSPSGRFYAERRAYAPPRLVEVATADALLEVLGPAQANYNGP